MLFEIPAPHFSSPSIFLMESQCYNTLRIYFSSLCSWGWVWFSCWTSCITESKEKKSAEVWTLSADWSKTTVCTCESRAKNEYNAKPVQTSDKSLKTLVAWPGSHWKRKGEGPQGHGRPESKVKLLSVSAHEELQGHGCKMPDFHRTSKPFCQAARYFVYPVQASRLWISDWKALASYLDLAVLWMHRGPPENSQKVLRIGLAGETRNKSVQLWLSLLSGSRENFIFHRITS